MVASQQDLESLSARLSTDANPIAIDAERASGYRYFQRAYLLQINHETHGIYLIDPIAIQDFQPLALALANREWVIHAAIQDLPCLTELGLSPNKLFDTELAGRLLGMPRVALAVMLETYLGVNLKKQHSAADWSRRPLPAKWLDYAALDVAYLLRLRDLVEAELQAAGKLDWAHEEFEAAKKFTPSPKGDQPWRRLSGVHLIADPRGRAVARALWYARDELAQKLDIAPGRLLADAAILATAQSIPPTSSQMAKMDGYSRPESKAHLELWWAAIERAMSEPKEKLPPRSATKERTHTNQNGVRNSEGRNNGSKNTETDPEANMRLANVKVAVIELSQELRIPPENLVTTGVLRLAAALTPSKLTAEGLVRILRENGSRPWQISLVTDRLLAALQSPEALTPPAASQ
jgi:ribonuclease D